MDFDLTYGSLGAGVQSSAVLAMSCLGLRGCPRADYFYFADTQSEPFWVYDHLEVLKAFAAKHGMEVAVVTAGNLGADIKARSAGTLRVEGRSGITNIPAFVRNEGGSAGLLNRQCTSVYKISPLQAEARRRLGFLPGERIAGKKRVRVLMGISADEIQRMKQSRDKWLTNAYPLIEASPPMTRGDCEALLREVGLPVPRKSACTFCPFRSDAEWLDLQQSDPVGFLEACQVDEAIRDFRAASVDGEVYLHRSLQPLRQVDFKPKPRKPEQRLLDFGFGNECEGHCGV